MPKAQYAKQGGLAKEVPWILLPGLAIVISFMTVWAFTGMFKDLANHEGWMLPGIVIMTLLGAISLIVLNAVIWILAVADIKYALSPKPPHSS